MTNLWKQFQGVVPRIPLLIGTVTAVNSGTVTVTLSNGGTYVARGTGTVGDTLVIQGGYVTSTIAAGITTFAAQDV